MSHPQPLSAQSFHTLCAIHKQLRLMGIMPGANLNARFDGSPARIAAWIEACTTPQQRDAAWTAFVTVAQTNPSAMADYEHKVARDHGITTGGTNVPRPPKADVTPTTFGDMGFDDTDSEDNGRDDSDDSAHTARVNDPTARPVYAPGSLEANVQAIAERVTQDALAGFTPNTVDESAVQAIVDAAIAQATMPTRVVLVNPTTNEERDCGIQHHAFPKLARMLSSRLRSGFAPNVWLFGPPGTGKSHAARAYAESIGVPFYYTGPLGTKYDLSGFVDAGGTYRDTDWFKCWSNGGVFLFDEIRGSVPSALLAFAGALANGHCSFPPGLVPRHKDCFLIVADNLPPGQTSADFNGGFKQDAMLGSRFVTLSWQIDEALESSMAFGDQGAEWVRMVRRYRRAAATLGAKAANVTPRAVEQGCALLAGGFTMDECAEHIIRGGLTDDAWSSLRAAA